MSARVATSAPTSREASGRLGVTTVAIGSSSSRSTFTASSASSVSPCFDTNTGSTTSLRTPRSRSAVATVETSSAEASIPVLAASTPMSVATAAIWRRTRSALSSSKASTPRVFCAVTATIAVVPQTPCASKVFRSAATPAPPPESDPAIDRTAGGLRRGAATDRSEVRGPARGASRTRLGFFAAA